MRDELLLLFNVAALLVVTGAFVRESLRRGWIERLERLALEARHRDRFGELRTRLMALARDGVVDPGTEGFASVYAGLTVLMRKPGRHDLAVQAVLGLPPLPRKSKAKYRRPIPREMARLYVDFAEALDRLCRDYHGKYRWRARLLDLMELWHPRRVLLWMRIRSRLESSQGCAEIRQIKSAERALRERAEPVLA